MTFTAQELVDDFAAKLDKWLTELGVKVTYTNEMGKSQKSDAGAHVGISLMIGDPYPDLTEAVEKMTARIGDRKTLHLYNMLLPEGVDWCAMGRSGNVVVRTVRQYDLNSDRLPLRFDIRWS